MEEFAFCLFSFVLSHIHNNMCYVDSSRFFFSKSGYHGTTRYFFLLSSQKKKEICFLFRLTRAFPQIMRNLFTDRLTGTLHVNLFLSLIWNHILSTNFNSVYILMNKISFLRSMM